MRKKRVVFFTVLILLITFIFTLAGCNPDDGGDDIILLDAEYSLLLSGLVSESEEGLPNISITKAMIKLLYEELPVEYTEDNPCYASDKTDVDGNKIPHTLKGVYLEDVLSKYTQSAGISTYGSMTLNALDGYVTVATEDVFNSQGRGSKMIIAFEYDGVLLNESERSGALRAVFPDQIANVWAKKLSSIEFSTDILLQPAVNKIYFYESIEESMQGEYEKDVEVQENIFARHTFYGVSLENLIENGILDVRETDKMHLCAWDYNSNTEDYEEFSTWTKYDVYSKGYLVSEEKGENGVRGPLLRAPVFDGPSMEGGMKVKNVLSISAFNTSIVCLETAFRKFDKDEERYIFTKDILMLLNMYDAEDSYVVTNLEGDEFELSASEIYNSKITKDETGFFLTYGNGINTIFIAKIAVKI